MKINIEEIMEEIRAEARSKGRADTASFDSAAKSVWLENSFDPAQYARSVQDISVTWFIQPERPIGTHGGLIGKIELFIKHIARKLLRFYIAPVVSDQSAFNERVARNLELVNCYVRTHSSDECSVEHGLLKHKVDAVLPKRLALLEDQRRALADALDAERAERLRLESELARLQDAVARMEFSARRAES